MEEADPRAGQDAHRAGELTAAEPVASPMCRVRCRVACAAVGAKMVHNHLTARKPNKLPRKRAVPRPEKPAVCSLVVRVVVLGRTTCWQLRPSEIHRADEFALIRLDIAVALHSDAVLVAIAVRQVVLSRRTFGIKACVYGVG